MLNIFLFSLSVFLFALSLLLPKMYTPDQSRTLQKATAINIEQGGGVLVNAPSASNKPLVTRGPVPYIQAKAAIIVDVNTGYNLYEKEPNTQLPIASLTKIMTAITAEDFAQPSDIVTVSKDALLTDGDAGGLRLNEQVSIRDLERMMFIESSNDASMALAEHIGRNTGAETFEDALRSFTEFMNKKALALEMTRTSYKNPTGLDVTSYPGSSTSSPGNFSTVSDLTKLVRYGLRYPALWSISAQKRETITTVSGLSHPLYNINLLTHDTFGIRGGKTGYTDLAGGSLMVLVEDMKGQEKIIIVLGSTFDGRFGDARRLINWIRK